MKTHLRSLMVAAMLAIPFAAGAQCMPVEVASGDSTGSAYTAPVNNYYNYSLSEMIFDAEEFAGAMTIDTIGFYLGSMNSMSFASDVRIYLKYTEKGSFASTADYEVVDASATLVYQGPLNCVHGWNNFALSTPFYYDGNGNLMVIVHDNSTGQDGTSRKFATSSTGSLYKTLVRYSDTQNPVPESPTFGGTTGRYQYRPVMRLVGCEATAATCRRLTNLALDTVTQTSATISWVDVYNSGATYSVSMSADGVDTLLASGLTGTIFTATGLAPNTQYSFSVRAHCSGSEVSLPVAINVRTECGMLEELPRTWSFENEELQGFTNALRLPWCMERYSTGSGNYTYYPYSASTNSAYAHSGSRFLYFYPGGSASYPDTQAVVLPQLDVTTYPMDGNRISFWCRTNSATGSSVLYVGTLSDPSNIGSFTLVDTVQVSGTDMRHCVVPLTASPATNAYVALVVLRGGTGYLALDDLTLEQLPQCGDIQHLQVDSTTDATVSLSWDAVEGATYTVYDMADMSVIASAVATNSYTVSGLVGQTTYTFGVRANCAGGDGVVTTLSVQTACAASVLPYVEDFETGGNYSCWTTVQTAASTGLNSSNPYSGSSAFRFYYSTNPPQYLISPLLAGTGDGVQLEFGYASEDNSYPESFAVGYSTTNNAPSSFTWLPEVTGIATGRQYVRYSEILAAPGIKYVAIKCTSNDQYYLYIDSLVVKEAPTCLPVSNLTVDSASMSSVWLSWTDLSNDGATYTVYMDSVVLASGLSDTEYEVENLEAATAYTFSVEANCSPEDASEAVSVSALTECGTESCQLSFYCTDQFSDGWNGAYISVMQSGTEMGTVACAVSNETYNVRVCSGAPVTLMWHGGLYDEEAVFTVRDGGGDSVFACAMEEADSFSQTSPFFTLASPCPDCLVPVVTVDSVGADAVAISWTVGNAIGYNVYINDTVVEAQGITDNSYTITGLAASTDYTISVEAICSASDTSGRGTVQVVTDCGGGSCDIVIVTGESGLMGASIDVMQGAALLERFYDVSAMTATDTIRVCGGAPISFVYHQTPYVDYGFASMISFTITNGGGAQIYNCLSGTNMVDGETFLTIADACPSCNTPQVELVSMTETSATIRWSATAGSYDVYRDGVLVQAGVADSSYTFTGLSVATDYVFGVVAVCSASDTADMATLSVRTPCSAVSTLPYAESFDAGLGCWTTVNNSVDGQPWLYQSGSSYLAAHSGGGMAMSVSYTTNAIHADAWLISPQVVLPAAGNDSLMMSWWFVVDGDYPEDNYEVRISTTTNEVASFTTQLDNVMPTELNGEWTQRTVNLTPYAGQTVYVAFHHYNSYDADFLAIDDVEIYTGVYVAPEPDTVVVVFETDNAAMGTTVPSPGTYYYGERDTVFFGSSVVAGHRFSHWEVSYIEDGEYEVDTLDAGYANGYYLPAMYLMGLDTVIFRAYFEVGMPDSTTITYAVNDASMGTITPAPGTYTIYVGDSIVATASANAGYELAYWVMATYRLGNLVLADTIDAVNPAFFATLPQAFADYDATITITAVFRATAATQYMVTLLTANEAMGSVVPAGSSAVNEGASFTATARPEAGFRFVAWMNGSEQVSEANPYTFTVTEDISLTATFAPTDSSVVYYNVTVVSDDEQMGTVDCSVATGQVAEGTVVTVTAMPAVGYHFLRWVDINHMLISNSNPYTFTVSGDIRLVATFEADATGIGDVEGASVSVCSTEGKIVVRGAEGMAVYVYDVNGRAVCMQAATGMSEEIAVDAMGVYLVKVGDAAARRVVVVR